MILDEVTRDRNSSIAHCAAVCRSWQQVIEKKTFARLTVTLKRLGDFSSMTKKRRHLIKNVWLSIDCAAVGRPTDFALYKTISSLLLELSKWEARGEFHLEISVRWAADSHQCFQYLQTGSDIHHREEPDRTISPADHSEPTRRLHSHCLMHLFARLYHASTRCLFPADFPSVPAVTSLLVRRQTKCEWISREGFNRLLDLLPNLRQIHYEPWRSLEGRNSVRKTRITVEGLHRAIFSHNIAKVVVFGDFNEDFDECWRADRRWHRVPISSSRTNPRMASPEIGQAFAQISRPLVHLSLSFAADASDFFETCQRSWVWTRLTSLALTSNLLAPKKDPKIVNDMLEKAGIVALQMPKLDVMELWNGRRGLACVFRYQASRDRAGHNAKITWRSTWPL